MTFTLPVTNGLASKAGLEAAIDSAISAVSALGATGWPYYATTAEGVAAVSNDEGFITSSQSAILFYRKTGGAADLLAQVGVALAEERLAALEALGVDGFTRKEAVKAAATGNLSLTGSYAVDGRAMVNGDRYLAPAQTDPAQNGIYVYNSAGAHARAADMNVASEVVGSAFEVTDGVTNAGKTYKTPSVVATLGTDPITFLVIGDASAIRAELDARVPPTAYTNAGGQGDRSGVVLVRASPGLMTGGSASAIVNGNRDYQSGISPAFASGAPVSGAFLLFDFGRRERRLITEARWRQGGDTSHGVWRWQGSNDEGVTWDNIGETFTLGGGTQPTPGAGTETTHATLKANNTGYALYRLFGVSGNTTNQFIKEIEFKTVSLPVDEFATWAAFDESAEADSTEATARAQAAAITDRARGVTEALLRSGMDYYADSAHGSDANGGTYYGGAKSTLPGVQALAPANGFTLGLSCGSEWRGMLKPDVNMGLVAGVPNAGSIAPPIINGAVVVSAGSWVASNHTDAAGKVYELSVSRNPSGLVRGDDRYLIWESGKWLRRVASVAAAAAAPGSFYPSPSIGASSTLYVHPFGSTDPRSDGKTYERTYETTVVEGYGNASANQWGQTFDYLHAKQSLGHYGPLSGGMRTTVRRCLLGRGGLHNAVIGSGVIEDSLIIDWDMDNAEAIPLVFYAADPRNESTVLRRTHFAHPGNPTSKNTVYSHASGGNPVHKMCTYEWCIGHNCGNFQSNAVQSRVVRDLVSKGASRAITIFGAGTVASIERVLGHFPNGFDSAIYNPAGVTIPLIRDVGLVCDGGVTANSFIPSGVTSMQNCTLYNGGASGSGSLGTATNNHDVVFIDGISTSSVILTLPGNSDYNVFCSITDKPILLRSSSGGTTYSLSQWQAATGKDLNSVVLKSADCDSLFLNGFSGLSSGDFRLNPDCRLRFGDGSLIISRVGIQSYSDFNSYSVKGGQPRKWPTPPATETEGVEYLQNPTAWDFYE